MRARQQIHLGCVAVLAMLASTPLPAGAAGAMVGVGFANGSCGVHNADNFALQGNDLGDGTWAFVLGDVNAVPTVGCARAVGQAYHGAFDPAAGGCVPAILLDGTLCLGPVELGLDTTPFSACMLLRGCIAGVANLLRT